MIENCVNDLLSFVHYTGKYIKKVHKKKKKILSPPLLYRLKKLTAKGAVADIYTLSCHESGDTPFVCHPNKERLVKVISRKINIKINDFEQEILAKNILGTGHPNIKVALDSGLCYVNDGGQRVLKQCLLLEPCGKELLERINDNTSDKKYYADDKKYVAENLVIIEQMKSALQFMHKKEFIHRDLKTENILWNGINACIIDFGFSKHKNIDECTEVLGTSKFLYPGIIHTERSKKARKENPKLDIFKYNGRFADEWSMSVVFFVMFFKNYPHCIINKTENKKEIHDILIKGDYVEEEIFLKVSEIIINSFLFQNFSSEAKKFFKILLHSFRIFWKTHLNFLNGEKNFHPENAFKDLCDLILQKTPDSLINGLKQYQNKYLPNNDQIQIEI